jgi:hypothetical protein
MVGNKVAANIAAMNDVLIMKRMMTSGPGAVYPLNRQISMLIGNNGTSPQPVC